MLHRGVIDDIKMGIAEASRGFNLRLPSTSSFTYVTDDHKAGSKWSSSKTWKNCTI